MQNSKHRICVVTGSRADYGILRPLLAELKHDADLQLVVTGMHLSPEFGLSWREIIDDGFFINRKIEMLISADTATSIVKSMGLGLIGFADAFEQLKPNLMIGLGDRYEILCAAEAALISKIPFAHLSGGDITEGAYDDAMRHAITKMAQLHFPDNEDSRQRIIQMGENPQTVFNYGTPALDNIRTMQFLGRSELENSLGFKFKKRNFLVTYHPVTLDNEAPRKQFEEVLEALKEFEPNTGILFTYPNSDTAGRQIIDSIKVYERVNPNARSYASLGTQRYFSVLKNVDVVIGNSSSGICEVPSFGIPTVDIGNRQKGRFAAKSIVWSECKRQPIADAIRKALTLDCSKVTNPYGDGQSAPRIAKKILESIGTISLQKKFYSSVIDLAPKDQTSQK